MTAALVVGVLVAGGAYLVLQPGLLRVILGFVLLGHAVNVLLVAAGGMHRREVPFVGEGGFAETADPLPQAFVLTAIVITFGITVYLLALFLTGEAGDEPEQRGPSRTEDGGAGTGTEVEQ